MNLVVNPRISKTELKAFLEAAGETEVDPAILARGLRKSYVLAAYEDQRLVGFVQVVADNATVAYICRLTQIKPAPADLAHILVKHVSHHFARVADVCGVAEKELAKTYKDLGFTKTSVSVWKAPKVLEAAD